MRQESAYLYLDLSYFFTPSEAIDYHLGKHFNLSTQHCLSLLESQQPTFPALASLLASLFRPCPQTHLLVLDSLAVTALINNDALKMLVASLPVLLDRMGSKDGATLEQQIALKTLLNLLYVLVDWIERKGGEDSWELNEFYREVKIDDTLMRMVTLSLQAHYIPIKKLTMLYTRVLANLFHHTGKNDKNPHIHPVSIYPDQQASLMPQENLLKVGELERLKKEKPPPSPQNPPHSPQPPIQHFYRKHNSGQCPLAQSIVVGLLRSLLTVCNCQSHKKFMTARGAGVDSFREWQLSYRWVIEEPDLLNRLPVWLRERVRGYAEFDEGGEDSGGVGHEFYSHKIYSTSAISSFFFLLLIALKSNSFMQYSYFLQLISDANGILVFLKFLTDKFINLPAFSRYPESLDPSFGFKEEAMLSVYGVLLMLYASCNHYPEKIRNYLFQYNSYLIIKKIPSILMGQSEQAQSQPPSLPSRQQLDALVESGSIGSSAVIMRKLTELCYDLLKIQIPFFSKKTKDNAANMRMIIEIYCKYPHKRQPQKLTQLQKLMLKSNAGLLKPEKMISSVEEMKTLHNDYNNLYYWANDYQPNNKENKSSPAPIPVEAQMGSPEAWLEENIWKYYD